MIVIYVKVGAANTYINVGSYKNIFDAIDYLKFCEQHKLEVYIQIGFSGLSK